MLTACGGGSSSSGITYNGSTSAASVSNTNATELASVALGSGSHGTSAGIASATTSGINSSAKHPGINTIVKNVADVMAGLVNHHSSTTAIAGVATNVSTASVSTASQTATYNYTGCTGTLSETITVNSISSQTLPAVASVTIHTTFSNYQAASCTGPTYDGGATITGTYEVYYDTTSTEQVAPLDISLNFSNLSAVYSASDAEKLDGTFGFTFTWADTIYYSSLSGYTFTMAAVYEDTASSLTYKASNYLAKFDGSGDLLTVSGTVYDPTYGYVTIATPSDLTYSNCGTGSGIVDATSGAIVLTGASGSVGTSSATINFTNDNTCPSTPSASAYGYTVTWDDGNGNTGTTAVQTY